MKLEEVKADLGQGVSLEMVLIPAGKFVMGSPASEKGRADFETQYEVTLTKPFYMGKYAVTQEQWQSVMGNNPSRDKGHKLPVTNLSWEDCQEFIKKLNAKTDGGYRLPTEAEWEYACRAGTITAYSYGASLTKADANIDSNSIKAVGSYRPNAFGLYDMHGNVREWCEDWYGDYPAGAVTDPKGPAMGEDRVLRGGSFFDPVSFARSSYQSFNSPALRGNRDGFRLARTADLKAWKAEEAIAKVKKEAEEAIAKVKKEAEEAIAKEAQKEVAKSLKKEVEETVDLGQGVSLDLVLIPAGTFIMGSPESEGRSRHEKQYEVTLTKPFYLGIYTVTQEQWFEIMGKNPSSTQGAKLPVTEVSWEDCQKFIKKLNEKTSGGYRLPTEAEWEYACRAGTTAAYSFGAKITPQDANYDDSNIGKPVAVGRYNPNAFGLYDMHGNVREWCEDWYADYPAGAVTDPEGPATGKWRVLRGGSFNCNESYARSSNRRYNTPPLRSNLVGFRLARTK